jgi:glycosyltransferase involved in cell wall biosynthesis
MMKVCLLSDTYPPDVGGLAVSVRRNARNLAAAGHQVYVVAPSHARPPGSWHLEADGPVPVYRLGTHSRLRETLADWFDLMVELDVAQEFALFHGYFLTYAGYLAALTARYRGKPSVVSARGNDIDVMPFDDRRAVFVLKALEWADAILVVTRDLALKATALSGRHDVQLVHNGVDGTLFAPQPPDPGLRASLGLDQRPVVGFVGEARAKKGLGRMLRIFPRLCEEVPAQLLLVGGILICRCTWSLPSRTRRCPLTTRCVMSLSCPPCGMVCPTRSWKQWLVAARWWPVPSEACWMWSHTIWTACCSLPETTMSG